mmetsp:Transcript_6731/g.7487  ORF Transcript_6731/g.7487 Transcript_6731/m.7487 type:complete len:222 (+) Transcript_6731:1-666(+)
MAAATIAAATTTMPAANIEVKKENEPRGNYLGVVRNGNGRRAVVPRLDNGNLGSNMEGLREQESQNRYKRYQALKNEYLAHMSAVGGGDGLASYEATYNFHRSDARSDPRSGASSNYMISPHFTQFYEQDLNYTLLPEEGNLNDEATKKVSVYSKYLGDGMMDLRKVEEIPSHKHNSRRKSPGMPNSIHKAHFTIGPISTCEIDGSELTGGSNPRKNRRGM